MEREVTIRYKPKSSHIYSKDSEATTHWQERTQDKDRDQGMKAKPVIGLQYRTEPKSLLPKATLTSTPTGNLEQARLASFRQGSLAISLPVGAESDYNR